MDVITWTLFTPDPAEYKSNLDLKIYNIARRMASHPKVLGLTLEQKLKYITHIHNISVQAHMPLQMIKTLTATGWGDTHGYLYKAVMRLLSICFHLIIIIFISYYLYTQSNNI